MGIPLSIGIGGSESKRKMPTSIRCQESSSFWLSSSEENKPPPMHRRPSNLKSLCLSTRFSRDELQAIYRSFKQECPSGVISEDIIKDIYSRFFPQGDASEYAHLVFRLLDRKGGGLVTFEGLILNLSTLLKGSVQDRLDWIFKLYDMNGDGFVSRDELTAVVSSIHQIVGGLKGSRSAQERKFVSEHVENVFKKMDLNSDGLIDMDEFTRYCLEEPQVFKGLEAMDVNCGF